MYDCSGDRIQSGALFRRREFVTGLGAFVASQIILPKFLSGKELPSDLKTLRLGFLTDCHAMAEHGAPGALMRSAELMNSLSPDLIIGGGDFVHGGFYSTEAVMEKRWEIAQSFLKSLRCRMEPVIGNHDFLEPLASDGTPSPGDPRRRWKKYFGQNRTYRSFEFSGYRFLILDSIKVVGGPNPYRGWIDAAQLLWLDQELGRIPVNQPIILCSHIPFRTSMLGSLSTIAGTPPGRVRVVNSEAVMDRLRARPVAMILQGHVHLNERLELYGIPCITGGAVCGNWWKGSNLGTNPGLGLIEITLGGVPSSGIMWDYRETPVA